MRRSEGRQQRPRAPRPRSQCSPARPSAAQSSVWGRRGRGRAACAAIMRRQGSASAPAACYQASAANRRPQRAQDGLWTPHQQLPAVFRVHTVQCSMSVSYAAQRNSHFVTELDPHQNARRCSLPLSFHRESGLPQRQRNKKGMPSAFIGGQGGQFLFNIFISLLPPLQILFRM